MTTRLPVSDARKVLTFPRLPMHSLYAPPSINNVLIGDVSAASGPILCCSCAVRSRSARRDLQHKQYSSMRNASDDSLLLVWTPLRQWDVGEQLREDSHSQVLPHYLNHDIAQDDATGG